MIEPFLDKLVWPATVCFAAFIFRKPFTDLIKHLSVLLEKRGFKFHWKEGFTIDTPPNASVIQSESKSLIEAGSGLEIAQTVTGGGTVGQLQLAKKLWGTLYYPRSGKFNPTRHQ